MPSGNATYSATPLFNDQSNAADTGIYLQDQMDVGVWSVMLGLRHDSLTENYHDLQLDFRNKHDATQTSPSAGVMFHVAPSVALYASYSRSLDSNLATNGCGRSYDPSRGAQYEAGAKGRRSRATAGAAWQTDEIKPLVSRGFSFGGRKF